MFKQTVYRGSIKKLANNNIMVKCSFQQQQQRHSSTTVAAAAINNNNNNNSLLSSSPAQFMREMKKNGIRRAFIVHDAKTKTTQTSHPMFDSMAHAITNDKRDFLSHEALFFEIGKKSNALCAAFIQKTVRGTPQGGVRLWNYDTMEGVVRDGLRLSAGMGRKNSLAGLYWGGGKGIIVKNSPIAINDVDVDGSAIEQQLNFEDALTRDVVFGDYGDFLTSLRGAYYGAEDVGLTPADTARMFAHTRFMTCIPQELGGSGNPSKSTGMGVVCGMEAALDFLKMEGGITGKKIVIQGAGNVAGFVLDDLLSKGVGKVIISDINEKLLNKRREQYKAYDHIVEFRLSPSPTDNSILYEPCDILAPCALGGIINSETIPKLNCKIIAGAANNQLLDSSVHDQSLKDRNIVYIPDYLLNRMGIVNCANENYGYVKNDPMIHRHFGREWENSIYKIAISVLTNSQNSGIPTGMAANKLADQLSEEEHPIMGHRTWSIIQGLIADKWAESSNH